MTNKSPSIFIVGAAKSGTTSLWAYLKQHPQLASSDRLRHKELGYYSNLYGINDKMQYDSMFETDDPGIMNFEACTSYLTSPESPFLIKESVPDAKIIVVIRNPVDRAFSLYNWMTSYGYEKASSFEKALELEPLRKSSAKFRKSNSQYFYNYLYKDSGLYYIQLKRYIDIFGIANVHVILYDDLIGHIHDELEKVCGFLDLKKFKFTTRKTHNKGKSVHSPLLQFYMRLIFIGILTHTLRLGRISESIYKKISQINYRKDKAILQPETKRALSEYYKVNIAKLEQLIQKPLSELWFSE